MRLSKRSACWLTARRGLDEPDQLTKSPVARVIEMIRREAQHYGVMVTHTELVGLIPQQALV